MSGNKYKDEQQLCWCCAKASGGHGGCDWERSGKPIEGWNATHLNRKFQNDSKAIDTFIIRECPEFMRDTNNASLDGSTFKDIKVHYTDKGITALMNELIYQAGRNLLETDSIYTIYQTANFLRDIGAEYILRKILDEKGLTYDDIQRYRAVVEQGPFSEI